MTAGDWLDPAARAAIRIVPPLPDSEEPAPSWAPVDLTDILAGNWDPPRPTILARADGPAMFYPATVNYVIGEPESGKSWVGLLACAEQIRAGRHAMFLDFESDAGSVVTRLQAIGVDNDAIAERFHYVRPTSPLGSFSRDGSAISAAGEQQAFRELLELADGCAVAVFDGVTEAMAVHGLNPLDNSDVARIHRLCWRPFADHGCALVVVDHVVKSADGRGRWPIGAQHKLALVSGAAYSVEPFTPFGIGRTGKAALTVVKDRPGQVRRHCRDGKRFGTLIIDSETETRAAARIEAASAVAVSEFRPTGVMEAVSLLVERKPGLSHNQVKGGVPAKHDTVVLALDTLVYEGFIERRAAPRNGHAYRSVRSYRESADPSASPGAR